MNNSSPKLFKLCIENYGIVAQLVTQQLTLRYRRNFLGFLWTLLNPLLMMFIMALVFSALFKVDLVEFSVFLFSGLVPWNFFSQAVSQSGNSLIANENLIKKIYIPKLVFPLSVSLALLIENTLAFLVLFLLVLMLGAKLSWALLFIPVAYLLLFFFTFGLSLLASVATVFFRDLEHLIVVGLQGLFFLTPILYGPERLSGKLVWLAVFNPVTPFIALFRQPLHAGELPELSIILRASALALCSLSIGLLVYRVLHKKIVFRL